MVKILIIEDNKVQAEASIGFLKSIGYEVAWAEDGKSAMKLAQTGDFDIALLDLVLPDMQGNQICHWLKHNDKTRNMQVIMLTAKDSVSDMVSGLDAGADDYLHKPYDKLELKARIGVCLRTKELQEELEAMNSQLLELLMKVEKLAITDPLTGLFNRRHFSSVLELEFYKLKRYNNPISCLVVDIDFFKKINDLFGHAMGDSVLSKIAERLTTTLRKGDIIARWGGEEFVVLLANTGRAKAEEAALRLLETIAAHSFSGLDGRQVTVSIGISCSTETHMDTSGMIVDSADKALYRAKESGRNQVVVYTEEMG